MYPEHVMHCCTRTYLPLIYRNIYTYSYGNGTSITTWNAVKISWKHGRTSAVVVFKIKYWICIEKEIHDIQI